MCKGKKTGSEWFCILKLRSKPQISECSYCFPKFGTESQKFRLNELEASKSKYEPHLVLKNKWKK